MGGRYRALLIGNSTYLADEHNLQQLKGPIKDIAVLNRALVDRDTGLFDDIDVTLLPEATSGRAVRALGRFFGNAGRDDVLLVYFSGHGKLDQNGRLHLCMQDTETTDLLATAVSSARINEFADASSARNVVIVLDCCHAGAFRGSDLGAALAGPGRYVMTSCRSTQLANDATVENSTSFFTQHLVDGLVSGAADTDGDGYIGFSDLYAYVDQKLREAGKQIPQRRVNGDGDLRLAQRTRPANVDVAAASDAPQPAVVTASPPRTPHAPTRGTGTGRLAEGRRRRALLLAAIGVVAVLAATAWWWVPGLGDRPGSQQSSSGNTLSACAEPVGDGWQPITLNVDPSGTKPIEGGSLLFRVEHGYWRAQGSAWQVALRTTMEVRAPNGAYHQQARYASLIVARRENNLTCYATTPPYVAAHTLGDALIGFDVHCKPAGLIQLVLEDDADRINVTPDTLQPAAC